MSKRRLVALPTGRVYVREEGTGPPVVLVHDVLLTQHAFRHLVPELARTNRVVSLDLPGCGESDRPPGDAVDGYSLEFLSAAVRSVMNELQIPRASFVGHGLGAAVAVETALMEPERVQRLLLVGALCFPSELTLEGRVSLLPVVGPVLFERVFGRGDLERHLRRSLAVPEALDALALDVYWDRLARAGGKDAALQILQNVERLERMHDRLPGIIAPALVVWGDRDVIVPRDHAQRLVHEIEDARLAVVEGCGHVPAEERPDELVRLINGFLAD